MQGACRGSGSLRRVRAACTSRAGGRCAAVQDHAHRRAEPARRCHRRAVADDRDAAALRTACPSSSRTRAVPRPTSATSCGPLATRRLHDAARQHLDGAEQEPVQAQLRRRAGPARGDPGRRRAGRAVRASERAGADDERVHRLCESGAGQGEFLERRQRHADPPDRRDDQCAGRHAHHSRAVSRRGRHPRRRPGRSRARRIR